MVNDVTIGAVAGGFVPVDTIVSVTGRANSHTYFTALNRNEVDGKFVLIGDTSAVDVVLSAEVYAAYHKVAAPIIRDSGEIQVAEVTVTGRVSRFGDPKPRIIAQEIVAAPGNPDGRLMPIRPRLRASAVWHVICPDPHHQNRPPRAHAVFAALVGDVSLSVARNMVCCQIIGPEDGVTAEVFVPDDVYAADGRLLTIGASVVFNVLVEREENRVTLTAVKLIAHPKGAAPGSLMRPLGGNRADDKATIAGFFDAMGSTFLPDEHQEDGYGE
jgi:hypothetical protein